jgi:hypothetical protein
VKETQTEYDFGVFDKRDLDINKQMNSALHPGHVTQSGPVVIRHIPEDGLLYAQPYC